MLYTKLGSIPQPQTDGTDGWIEVADKPECPEGKEVVWLNWEWIIRDPKPQDRLGYQWNWNHGEMAWIESEYVVPVAPEPLVIEEIEVVPALVIEPEPIPEPTPEPTPEPEPIPEPTPEPALEEVVETPEVPVELLSTDQIQFLGTDQVSVLTTDQLVALSEMTTDQLAALSAMTTDQISRL